MKVKPSLYLNMSPQTTEEGALAFARNMKLDDDGNLVSDYGYKDITCTVSNDVTPAVALNTYNIVGHIVGLDNKIYFFTLNNKIIEYDEVEETATKLATRWTYGGGEIDGYVNTNQSGEKILTIGEYLPNGSNIPLKHINLKFANVEQSLYSQAPTCPTANLVLDTTYVKTIPNGVYVFFIRYKIRKDVYTNWFLCSRPIFSGTSEKITTLQGGVSYINTHRDSGKSFVFHLDFAQTDNILSYNEFQLGFIITHDEATDARAWKHFDMGKFRTAGGTIYFDYEDVEEANIDDLLETTYELYNVRNVTAFKNKLYISNYIESDFNPDLQALANCIHLTEVHSGGSDADYKNFKLGSTSLTYDYSKGFYSVDKNNRLPLLITRDLFNYNINKLAKTGTKEKKDVVKFDLIWSDDYDPDIAIVYNIYNYLYNKEVFGPDYADPYEFTVFDNTNDINKGLGLEYLYGSDSDNLWVYTRQPYTRHPWDSRGITFAFGSFSEGDSGKKYARLGCSYFNEDTHGRYGSGDKKGWVTRASGFTKTARAAMSTKLKEDIANKSFWGKAYVEIASGANIYPIGYQDVMDLDNYAGSSSFVPLDNSLFSTETISDNLKDNIKNFVFNSLKSVTLQGIDENGTLVIYINGEYIRVTSVYVKFKKFDFDLEIEDIEDSEGKIYKSGKVNMTTTDYTCFCSFSMDSSYISVSDTVTTETQTSTLMPLSTYDAYVHFVDEHNIITNGIKFDNFTTGPATSNRDIIRLNYRVTNLPTSKYKSFFISLVNIGNIVIECFDCTKNPYNDNENIVHCLEIDSMLYNINDNIVLRIYNNSGTFVSEISGAKYYSSGSNYPPLAFGNCGYISFTGSDDYTSCKIYAVIARNKNNENVNNLSKSSSYIPLKNTSDTLLPDGYYGSWFCLVKKPSFSLSSICYVSGKDVYSINRETSLSLSEFKSYIQVQDSVTYFIRSNFNLNYLSLIEDINDNIFTVGNTNSGVKQVAKVINSATLSFIYELKPMYKDFFNKYFKSRDVDYKIDFDNTVRVSHVLSDETFNNSVFKFASADYYNVPTDRGIIVNLFSIGNNIFVHCKGSLYKFDGNATIAANDKDIQLQSTEPFNAGVTQILDSEYGYGGIDTKQAGCITFDSYFFYDRASNHIFAYGGNSQIQLIDGNIYKLLSYYKPSECKTLHDELNCRVLFEFTSGRDEYNRTGVSYNTFTISYNYKTKTFVSFHDISLINAFASRHKAYSYKSALVNLFNTYSQIDTTKVVEEMNVNRIFGGATTACIIEFGSQIYKKQASPFGIAVVLFPQANLRETIDSVRYVSDIQQLDSETQSIPVYDVLVNPQVTRDNPVINFYIITDSCISSLVTTNVDDTARPDIGHEDQKDDKYYRKHNTSTTPMTPSTLMDYKGFKYDMGFWTSNYFRNKLNEADIYKYSDTVSRALGMDRNSLVYGRYFILVFDFKPDTPIKFEDVYMNTDKY